MRIGLRTKILLSLFGFGLFILAIAYSLTTVISSDYSNVGQENISK